MKATGSKLLKVLETVNESTDSTGEVYYDYERSLFLVMIDGSLHTEHKTQKEAEVSMYDYLERYF